MSFILIVILLTTISYLFWGWLKKKYGYFKERDIVHEPGLPVIGSTIKYFFSNNSFPDFLLDLSDKFRKQKFFGLFTAAGPGFIIQDPDLIKQITVKDFDHFVNRSSLIASEKDELLINSLSLLHDQKWRDMRSTLSPAFTGSKMRMMFDLVRECAEDLVSYCRETAQNGRTQISTKDVFSKVTTDMIATTAFGLKVDSLRDETNPIFVNAQKSFNLIKGAKTSAKIFLLASMPKLANKLGITVTPVESTAFFKKVIKDTMDLRRRDKIFRPDLVQLLIQAMDGKLTHDPQENNETYEAAAVEESLVGKSAAKTNWTDIEIAAQCFLFFIAGYSTTSNMLTFAAYELAINADVQDRLHQEILVTKSKLNGAPISYEVLHKMQYLDAFVSETLRKHPIGFIIDRKCNKETTIEDETGKKYTIPAGFLVWINVIGLHYNHTYFPNPTKFDPDRFMGENRDKIQPNTFIPFGVGPRACIGSRFALMEIKVLLYTLLSAFSFEVCDETMVRMKWGRGFEMYPSREMIIELRQRKADATVS